MDISSILSETDLRSYIVRLQSECQDTLGLTVPGVAQILGSKVSWGNITGDISKQADLIFQLTTLKEELEKEIEAGTTSSSIFSYKGQVSTAQDLPTGATVGDVYDVTDTGANYVWNGTSWDKLSESLDGLAKATDLETAKAELTSLITELTDDLQAQIKQEIEDRKAAEVELLNAINQKLDKVTHEEYVEKANADNEIVNLKITELSEKITDLKSLDPEVLVLYDGSDTEYENTEKDFTISGVISDVTSISGNNIALKDVTILTAGVNLTASQDVSIKDTTLTGLVPKKTTSALFKIYADGYVNMTDCTINPESAYNCLEIGNELGLAKCVSIDNVDFTGHFVNNAINIYGMAENGIVTISNCSFTDVNHLLNLGNRTNVPFIINIINCTIDSIGTENPWVGLIACEDVTSGSADAANTNDIFSKLIINIQNVTIAGNKLTKPDDLATICGTKDSNQILYVWDEWRGSVEYGDKYPTLNIA